MVAVVCGQQLNALKEEQGVLVHSEEAHLDLRRDGATLHHSYKGLRVMYKSCDEWPNQQSRSRI
jgi:oligoribonuclease (3'-5' exoribonuclease)